MTEIEFKENKNFIKKIMKNLEDSLFKVTGGEMICTRVMTFSAVLLKCLAFSLQQFSFPSFPGKFSTLTNIKLELLWKRLKKSRT